MARGNLAEHAAGDDVARCELGEPVARQHEALALGVDQCCAFAAQRFGGERGVDRGTTMIAGADETARIRGLQ